MDGISPLSDHPARGVRSSSARGRNPARLAAVAATLLLLAGCAVTPPRPDLPLQLPDRFSISDPQPYSTSEHWWQEFRDPSLDQLMTRAFEHNFSLRAAWARLDQANALARRTGAPLWPELNLQYNLNRQIAESPKEVTTKNVQLSASYELDLWGRIRAASEAADFDAQASAADLQTSAITLSATLADTWYQLIEQRMQLALVENQITTNKNLLRLVEARFRVGQASASDIYRQRQLLAQTEGEQAKVRRQLQILKHQLAVLLGSVPGYTQLPEDSTLPQLPPLPATGIPATLVQRRPDLQAAFLQLRAADARAAEAVAARYPRLDLSAVFRTPGGSTGALFESWLGTLAAQLAAPLFDGGQRKAEADRTGAVVTEKLNNYGQTLLEAIGEVEDALISELEQRAYLESLSSQSQQAEAVVRQERQRYFQGDSDYLSVLDALRSRQSLERQQVTAERELLSNRIALVRALAGGWIMTPPMTDSERKN